MTAKRFVQIKLNGEPITAEVDKKGRGYWIEFLGRKILVPAGKNTLAVNARTGAVSTVVPVSAPAEERDEQDVEAEKLRRVREAARRGVVPKSQRPSVRQQAARLTARQHEAAVWRNAYDNAMAQWAQLPLNQRVTEADVEGLVELVMERVLADPDLRAGYRLAADLADQVELSTEEVEDRELVGAEA